MAGGRRNFGRKLREEYEKAMSLADGKNVYIGKIAEGIRHRLVYDHDGDGLYNGTFDWDSGELHAYCETDENNTKIDAN